MLELRVFLAGESSILGLMTLRGDAVNLDGVNFWWELAGAKRRDGPFSAMGDAKLLVVIALPGRSSLEVIPGGGVG